MMTLPPDTIIAAGPVIIEDGKVLLNRSKNSKGQESPYFMFPGGKMQDFASTLEETCIREVQEELGINIQILRPLKTIFAKRVDTDSYIFLVHYLAKRIGEVTPGNETVEWGWFDVHNLPNVTPNVKEVLDAYFSELPVWFLRV